MRRRRHMGSFSLESGPPDPTFNSAQVIREWQRQYSVAHPGESIPGAEVARDSRDVNLIPFDPSTPHFVDWQKDHREPVAQVTIDQSAVIAAEKKRQEEERQRAAREAEAARYFRGYWEYREADRIGRSGYLMEFARTRGIVEPGYGFENEEQVRRARAEINDPELKQRYCPNLVRKEKLAALKMSEAEVQRRRKSVEAA